jgi:hypothetical protein
MEAPKSFLRRMNETFKTPGQTIKEFSEELKKLTPEDRADFKRYFQEAGLPVSE